MYKNKFLLKVGRLSCFLLGCFFYASAFADDSLLARVEALQQAGEAQQAFQLLQSGKDEYAGDIEFDYMFGKLALDVGKPLQAVFALERVLDQRPDFAPARAELAKAYFLIGENEAARAEFKQAQKAEMPAESKKIIASYISTIDERILGAVSDSAFYIAAGLGYDSNVNSATSTSQIAVPTGTLTLLSPETDSTVGWIQGGGRFNYAVKHNINVYGSADLRLYEAFEEKDFSTQVADGVLGLHFLQGLNQYRVSVVAQAFALDGRANRNLLGMSGQWQRTIDAANQFTLFGQYASLRFPDAARLDVNQLSVGATWLHLFANPSQPITYITAYYGSEDEQTTIVGSEFVGRDYFGFRAGMRFKTSARLLWSAVLTYQQSEYGGEHPIFGDTRADDFVNIIAGADYLLNRHWSVRPEVTYSSNSSSLEINDYDRLRAMVTVRRDF